MKLPLLTFCALTAAAAVPVLPSPYDPEYDGPISNINSGPGSAMIQDKVVGGDVHTLPFTPSKGNEAKEDNSEVSANDGNEPIIFSKEFIHATSPNIDKNDKEISAMDGNEPILPLHSHVLRSGTQPGRIHNSATFFDEDAIAAAEKHLSSLRTAGNAKRGEGCKQYTEAECKACQIEWQGYEACLCRGEGADRCLKGRERGYVS
jgi:hypothetical protein